MADDFPREKRVPYETPINIEFEKFSGFLQEYSHNISEGGMFIKTRHIKPVGTVFSFEFKLKDDFVLIHGWGEVRWVREKDEGPDKPAGMGIKFIDLDKAGRDLIKKIVQNRPHPVPDPTTPPENLEKSDTNTDIELTSPWSNKPKEKQPEEAASSVPEIPDLDTQAQDLNLPEIDMSTTESEKHEPQAESFANEVMSMAKDDNIDTSSLNAAELTEIPAGDEPIKAEEKSAQEPSGQLHELIADTLENDEPSKETDSQSQQQSEKNMQPDEEIEELEEIAPTTSKTAWLILAIIIAALAGAGIWKKDIVIKKSRDIYLTVKFLIKNKGKEIPTIEEEKLLDPSTIQVQVKTIDKNINKTVKTAETSVTSPQKPESHAAKVPAPAEVTEKTSKISEQSKNKKPEQIQKKEITKIKPATKITNISYATSADMTTVSLEGNGKVLQKNTLVAEINSIPSKPRLLIKIKGIKKPYKRKKIKVKNSKLVKAIRTALHKEDSTLHIVLDLKRKIKSKQVLQENKVLIVQVR